MLTKEFPTLYKKSGKTGAVQQWTISVAEDTLLDFGWYIGVITTKHGQVGGAIQSMDDVVTEGKSIGKVNETSPYQQACAEAESKWTKQKKKGYVESYEDAVAGKTDEIIEGGVFPMLAHTHTVRITDLVTGAVTMTRKENNIKKVKYPAYAQPKLDGIRCLFNAKDETAWSRTRHEHTSVPLIADVLGSACPRFDGLIFDGELYNHDLRDDFEKIVSAVRKAEPSPESEMVEYHIYDIAGEGTFAERHQRLIEAFNCGKWCSVIRIVETVMVESEADLYAYLTDCLSRGYEGCMVRNADGLYGEGCRSTDLQKLKDMFDDEFEVVDVKEGRGKMAGKAIFTCHMGEDFIPTRPNDNGCFDVKMEGSLDNLSEYLQNPPIHKMLTVRYQGFSVYGKPRFPVGKTIRDYE